MLGRLGWNGAALAAALALGMTAPAAAQDFGSVGAVSAGSGGSCLPEDFAGCDTATTRCGDDTGWCVYGSTGSTYCLTDGLFLCCNEDSDCPNFSGSGGTALSCEPVAGVDGDFTGDPSLCLESHEYCSAGSDPTLAEVRQCHRSARGDRLLVRWEAGDCDADGLPNGTDPNVCVAPDARGYWTTDHCTAIASGCDAGDGCAISDGGGSGTCAETEDGNGTRCEPHGEVLYCGGPQYVCPDGMVMVNDGDRLHSFCVKDQCEGSDDVASLLDCITGPGEDITLYSLGDCDGDGTANALDEAPCQIGDEPADGGMNAGTDAGPEPGVDAGNGGGLDAGQPTDPGIDPNFQGGGGCACRAAPGRSELPLGALSMLLGLVVARLRRR